MEAFRDFVRSEISPDITDRDIDNAIEAADNLATLFAILIDIGETEETETKAAA